MLDEVNHIRAHAIMLATPEPDRGKVRLADKLGPRSMQYMVDLLPHIQEFIATQPRGTRFTVLDVGPGTGHGTALLADLYRGNPLGYGMQVSGLDIRDYYATYFAAHFPDLPLVIEDVFDHHTKYDIVVTSHAIEHIPDPLGFCRRLQEMARLAVFVSAPFNEPPGQLAAGHINIIDDAFLEQLQADQVVIHKSVSWGAFKDPPYESIIARLPGRGTS